MLSSSIVELYVLCIVSGYVNKNKIANHALISIHTHFRYLKTPERQQRIRRLRNEIVNKRKEVERLKSYVNVATEQHGIYIEEALETDIKQIMEEKSNEIRKTYQADSFQCIFWNQQLELLKLKDKRQIRWHPMMIRWCLSLKLLSSASYHALRSSNFKLNSYSKMESRSCSTSKIYMWMASM